MIGNLSAFQPQKSTLPVAFAPNGWYGITVCDATLRLMSHDDIKHEDALKLGGTIRAVEWSPSSKHFAVLLDKLHEVIVFAVHPLQPVAKIYPRFLCTGIRFDPSGCRLLLSHPYGCITAYDLLSPPASKSSSVRHSLRPEIAFPSKHLHHTLSFATSTVAAAPAPTTHRLRLTPPTTEEVNAALRRALADPFSSSHYGTSYRAATSFTPPDQIFAVSVWRQRTYGTEVMTVSNATYTPSPRGAKSRSNAYDALFSVKLRTQDAATVKVVASHTATQIVVADGAGGSGVWVYDLKGTLLVHVPPAALPMKDGGAVATIPWMLPMAVGGAVAVVGVGESTFALIGPRSVVCSEHQGHEGWESRTAGGGSDVASIAGKRKQGGAAELAVVYVDVPLVGCGVDAEGDPAEVSDALAVVGGVCGKRGGGQATMGKKRDGGAEPPAKRSGGDSMGAAIRGGVEKVDDAVRVGCVGEGAGDDEDAFQAPEDAFLEAVFDGMRSDASSSDSDGDTEGVARPAGGKGRATVTAPTSGVVIGGARGRFSTARRATLRARVDARMRGGADAHSAEGAGEETRGRGVARGTTPTPSATVHPSPSTADIVVAKSFAQPTAASLAARGVYEGAPVRRSVSPALRTTDREGGATSTARAPHSHPCSRHTAHHHRSRTAGPRAARRGARSPVGSDQPRKRSRDGVAGSSDGAAGAAAEASARRGVALHRASPIPLTKSATAAGSANAGVATSGADGTQGGRALPTATQCVDRVVGGRTPWSGRAFRFSLVLEVDSLVDESHGGESASGSVSDGVDLLPSQRKTASRQRGSGGQVDGVQELLAAEVTAADVNEHFATHRFDHAAVPGDGDATMPEGVRKVGPGSSTRHPWRSAEAVSSRTLNPPLQIEAHTVDVGVWNVDTSFHHRATAGSGWSGSVGAYSTVCISTDGSRFAVVPAACRSVVMVGDVSAPAEAMVALLPHCVTSISFNERRTAIVSVNDAGVMVLPREGVPFSLRVGDRAIRRVTPVNGEKIVLEGEYGSTAHPYTRTVLMHGHLNKQRIRPTPTAVEGIAISGPADAGGVAELEGGDVGRSAPGSDGGERVEASGHCNAVDGGRRGVSGGDDVDDSAFDDIAADALEAFGGLTWTVGTAGGATGAVGAGGCVGGGARGGKTTAKNGHTIAVGSAVLETYSPPKGAATVDGVRLCGDGCGAGSVVGPGLTALTVSAAAAGTHVPGDGRAVVHEEGISSTVIRGHAEKSLEVVVEGLQEKGAIVVIGNGGVPTPVPLGENRQSPLRRCSEGVARESAAAHAQAQAVDGSLGEGSGAESVNEPHPPADSSDARQQPPRFSHVTTRTVTSAAAPEPPRPLTFQQLQRLEALTGRPVSVGAGGGSRRRSAFSFPSTRGSAVSVGEDDEVRDGGREQAGTAAQHGVREELEANRASGGDVQPRSGDATLGVQRPSGEHDTHRVATAASGNHSSAACSSVFDDDSMVSDDSSATSSHSSGETTVDADEEGGAVCAGSTTPPTAVPETATRTRWSSSPQVTTSQPTTIATAVTAPTATRRQSLFTQCAVSAVRGIEAEVSPIRPVRPRSMSGGDVPGAASLPAPPPPRPHPLCPSSSIPHTHAHHHSHPTHSVRRQSIPPGGSPTETPYMAHRRRSISIDAQTAPGCPSCCHAPHPHAASHAVHPHAYAHHHHHHHPMMYPHHPHSIPAGYPPAAHVHPAYYPYPPLPASRAIRHGAPAEETPTPPASCERPSRDAGGVEAVAHPPAPLYLKDLPKGTKRLVLNESGSGTFVAASMIGGPCGGEGADGMAKYTGGGDEVRPTIGSAAAQAATAAAAATALPQMRYVGAIAPCVVAAAPSHSIDVVQQWSASKTPGEPVATTQVVGIPTNVVAPPTVVRVAELREQGLSNTAAQVAVRQQQARELALGLPSSHVHPMHHGFGRVGEDRTTIAGVSDGHPRSGGDRFRSRSPQDPDTYMPPTSARSHHHHHRHGATELQPRRGSHSYSGAAPFSSPGAPFSTAHTMTQMGGGMGVGGELTAGDRKRQSFNAQAQAQAHAQRAALYPPTAGMVARLQHPHALSALRQPARGLVSALTQVATATASQPTSAATSTLSVGGCVRPMNAINVPKVGTAVGGDGGVGNVSVASATSGVVEGMAVDLNTTAPATPLPEKASLPHEPLTTERPIPIVYSANAAGAVPKHTAVGRTPHLPMGTEAQHTLTAFPRELFSSPTVNHAPTHTRAHAGCAGQAIPTTPAPMLVEPRGDINSPTRHNTERGLRASRSVAAPPSTGVPAVPTSQRCETGVPVGCDASPTTTAADVSEGNHTRACQHAVPPASVPHSAPASPLEEPHCDDVTG